MKNLKKKFRFRINLKSKHLLAIMTLFCLCCIVSTFASGISTAPLQEAAGIVIVPFEKSIEKIGSMIRSAGDSFQDKQDLIFENEELKAQIDSLTTQNNKLIQDQGEYQRLKELYDLDLRGVSKGCSHHYFQGSGQLVRYLYDQQGLQGRNPRGQ